MIHDPQKRISTSFNPCILGCYNDNLIGYLSLSLSLSLSSFDESMR